MNPDGWGAAFISIALAWAYFEVIFPGARFIWGTSSYWQTHIQDVTQYISGLTAFRNEPWGLPLLRINSINWSTGTSVAFTDAIPLFALVLKVLGPIAPENPFGIWVLLCFLLLGLATWWALKQSGQINWISLILAVGLCVQMPALSYRLGHLSLMAHFLIVLAIGLYFRDRLRGYVSTVGWGSLVLLSFYINFYITAMVLTIMVAAAADLCRDGHWSGIWRYGLAFLPLAITFPIMFGFGFGSSVQEGGFDYYSMNLLAPLVGGSIIDFPSYSLGTIGQSEGYNYLGFGLLGACAAVAFARNALPLRQIGPSLIAACIILTGYAVSNDVYAGPLHLIHWDVPWPLTEITGTFRVSGRFFWPVSYVLAFVVALAIARMNARRAAVACVVILAVQWIDLETVRARAQATSQRPAEIVADIDAWSTSLNGVETIYFYPKFRCGKADHAEILPIQLIASKLHLKITTGYLARYVPDCNAEATEIATAGLETSAFVYSMSDFNLEEAKERAPREAVCHQQDKWILCR